MNSKLIWMLIIDVVPTEHLAHQAIGHPTKQDGLCAFVACIALGLPM